MTTELTAERLRELFDYDPITGVLLWRIPAARNIKPGDVAGSINSRGYRLVEIGGKKYRAHRVIWCMQTGSWPTLEIDHRDTDGANNVWKNLRLATRSQNTQNTRPQSGNSTGFKGVYWSKDKKKFRAQIQANGVKHTLGTYKTALSASVAYANAAFRLHGEFARIA